MDGHVQSVVGQRDKAETRTGTTGLTTARRT